MRVFSVLILLALQAVALWEIHILRIFMIALFLDALALAAIFGASALGAYQGAGITAKSPPWLLRLVGWCVLLGITAALAALAWRQG